MSERPEPRVWSWSTLGWLPQAALIGVARALPARARLAFASAFARTLVTLVPSLRARVEGNLRMIFPDMPAAERRRIRGENGRLLRPDHDRGDDPRRFRGAGGLDRA